MMDCGPLLQAIVNSFESFHKYFRINPMTQMSLPGLAFRAAFDHFDQTLPPIFTFSQPFNEIRELFRQNQFGGLVNVYHRMISIGGDRGPRNSRFAPNGCPYSYFLFLDFNSLYLYSQDQLLPLGPGVLWSKSGNYFTKKVMVSGVSRGQIEWLQWLQTQDICIDSTGRRVKIAHGMNGNEHVVSNRPVDGFFQKDGENYYLEYYGCRFHPGCCVPDAEIPNYAERRRMDEVKRQELEKDQFQISW